MSIMTIGHALSIIPLRTSDHFLRDLSSAVINTTICIQSFTVVMVLCFDGGGGRGGSGGGDGGGDGGGGIGNGDGGGDGVVVCWLSVSN